MRSNSGNADSLEAVDVDVYTAIQGELERQRGTLELIASENFAPIAVMEAQGSVLTNKYAEGYPGRRYYAGCEHVDVIEQLAIDRCKQVFGASFANVQPHSGAQANAAALAAMLDPGDPILGLELSHGGHLTHGTRMNFSGKIYKASSYRLRASDLTIDMNEVADLAREHLPKVIIAGWSAYPHHLDFQQFRKVADDVGALLLVDMAHFAGLVATGLHPSPIPFADVVTTTTHKTLGGPRGGIIMTNDAALAKRIDSAVFPGQQGGPLEHVIAAKAVALKLAMTEEFHDRQTRTLEGARAIADRLQGADVAAAGIRVVGGGTKVHLVLVDLRDAEIDGAQAESLLHEVGLTVNRNAIPFDPRPPMVTSGLRIGTAALATRGFGSEEFIEVADIIAHVLTERAGSGSVESHSDRVQRLVRSFPLYPGL